MCSSLLKHKRLFIWIPQHFKLTEYFINDIYIVAGFISTVDRWWSYLVEHFEYVAWCVPDCRFWFCALFNGTQLFKCSQNLCSQKSWAFICLMHDVWIRYSNFRPSVHISKLLKCGCTNLIKKVFILAWNESGHFQLDR